MKGITLHVAAFAALVAAQPAPAPAQGHFTTAEVRAMCRGESSGQAEFRTEAAQALLAEFQRSRCSMYLLGVADGIDREHRSACAPGAAERDALAALLVEAILRPPANPDSSVAAIVTAVLRARPPCP